MLLAAKAEAAAGWECEFWLKQLTLSLSLSLSFSAAERVYARTQQYFAE